MSELAAGGASIKFGFGNAPTGDPCTKPTDKLPVDRFHGRPSNGGAWATTAVLELNTYSAASAKNWPDRVSPPQHFLSSAISIDNSYRLNHAMSSGWFWFPRITVICAQTI